MPLLAAGAVLAASLLVTWMAWSGARDEADRRLQETFDYRVRDAQRRIANRIGEYGEALRGLAGLFAAEEGVSRAAFGRYVATLDVRRSVPGVQAVGYMPLVAGPDREAFVASVRREGIPAFDVRPAGARDALAPVTYVEPFSGANLQALGFDPLADRARRDALERARDSGEPAISEKVALVQDGGGTHASGAILYMPAYRGGVAPATPEARRSALRGWVYLAFRIPDFMAGLLGERAPDLDVEIYDGASPTAEGSLHDPDGKAFALKPGSARFQSTRVMDVAGHRWTLAVRSTNRFVPAPGVDRPRVVALSGAVIAVLLSVLTFLLATSRARVRAALERSESLARVLMRNFPNGFVGLFDRDRRYLLADGTKVVSVPDAPSLVGRTLDEIAPSSIRDAVEPAYRSALEGRPAGTEVVVGGRVLAVTTHPVRDPSGEVTMGVVMTQDVTEHRRAEEQARAAAAYTRSLIEASLDPLVTISTEGKITDVNAATEAATGLSRERLVGTDFADYFTDPGRAREGYQRVIAEGSIRDFALTMRHVSGRTVEVLYNASIFANPDHTLGGVLATARDVTEVRALQAQLAIQSRLAALGTLVGGMAHEVNNPLAATLSNVELALAEVEEARSRLQDGAAPLDRPAEARRLDEVLEDLAEAQEGARRVARIVKELRTFARPQAERQEVRLADVAAKALRWLPSSVHQGAAVSVEDVGAPPVLASFGQLEQVVVNLVTNAARATRPGRRNEVVIRTLAGPDGMARLEVSDQGTGIPPDVLPRIFDPFFTTREVGQGMGLGLAVCHSIVAAHGGRLTVESRVGEGSTFRMDLPGVTAASPERRSEPGPA